MKKIKPTVVHSLWQFLPATLMLCCIGLVDPGFAQRIVSLNSALAETKAPIASVRVVKIHHHDPRAFTQGLVYHEGFLYESKGLRGQSALQKKDLKSGNVLQEARLTDQYFAEGIAVLGGKIYQLTYQSETGFIYDLDIFKKTGHFSYRGEGWGLATDGQRLFMTDGSARITVRHPKSFRIERTISVTDGKRFVTGLNELEMIKGEIWANIYTQDVIVRIDPQTGRVKGWIDLGGLRSYLPANAQVDVLNGIAYDPENDRIFVTGKFWPKLFEIQVKP